MRNRGFADGAQETTLAVRRSLEPIYTGGKVEVCQRNGRCVLLMRAGRSFVLCDPITGETLASLSFVPHMVDLSLKTIG